MNVLLLAELPGLTVASFAVLLAVGNAELLLLLLAAVMLARHSAASLCRSGELAKPRNVQHHGYLRLV